MHARDHFSKFSWAYPLVNKTAAGVAERLMTIFTQFGPPKILQSDNNRAFVATVITELKHIWTDLLIIHGRPRHPQSQGCIERANGDLEIKLGCIQFFNG
jgi:transposase InsO family protein